MLQATAMCPARCVECSRSFSGLLPSPGRAYAFGTSIVYERPRPGAKPLERSCQPDCGHRLRGARRRGCIQPPRQAHAIRWLRHYQRHRVARRQPGERPRARRLKQWRAHTCESAGNENDFVFHWKHILLV